MKDIVFALLAAVVTGTALLGVLSIVIISWKNGISPMPASAVVRRAVAREARLLQQESPGGLLIEAGSGWGTLAFHLDKHCRGWRIIGLENSFVPLAASRLVNALNRSGARVSFLRQNIYDYNFGDAGVIVCYLYPGANKRLAGQWRDQCKPGACIVSACFALPDWKPEKEVICRDMYRTKVYVYRVPAQKPPFSSSMVKENVQTTGK